MEKRIELSNQLELNHNYLAYVWHLEQVYHICLAISGKEDKDFKKRIQLISRLIRSCKKKFNFKIYSMVLAYLNKNIYVINSAVDIIHTNQGGSEYIGDYYIPGTVAISIHD
jgi:hypothetical protein